MLLLRYLKIYLPAHSILRGFVALHLCDFADAIRAGCAEAKGSESSVVVCDLDAIRAGCAEAKIHVVHKSVKLREMQSVRDALRQR